MSRFQAGALVVYGNLGVHEVEGVGLRHFCDESAREYYTLPARIIPFSDSHDRSYIPTAKEELRSAPGDPGTAGGSRPCTHQSGMQWFVSLPQRYCWVACWAL